MYGKVYSKLVTSSIWSESAEVCKVWVTLIVLADSDGYVWGSVCGLARVCALTIETVAAALEKFKAPDPYSSDLLVHPENEGRRLEEVDGGWRLINYVHYRNLKSVDEQRLMARDKKRRQRADSATTGTVPGRGDIGGQKGTEGDKGGQAGQPSSPSLLSPTSPSSLSPVSRPPVSGEPETSPVPDDGEFRLTPGEAGKRPRPGIVKRTPAEFEEFWAAYPRARRTGKGDALKAWNKLGVMEQTQALRRVVEFARIWALAEPERHVFCPGPAPWLNQHRWEDDPEAWRLAAAGDQPGALAAIRRAEGRVVATAGLPADIVALIASKRESGGI